MSAIPRETALDEANSEIPAGYTYLGQFIDHDLVFDPVSSLQRANDPQALVDYRTPRFDLDCLYGRGPVDEPYLYEKDGIRMRLGDRLGEPLPDGTPPPDRDVPRNNDGTAIIGDPRNDENVIVAQLHAVFLRFHNRVADELKKQRNGKEPKFEEVQRLVRWHYQYVVLNDFLKRVIDDDTYNDILPTLTGKKENLPKDAPKLRFYDPQDEAYIPIEFSAAAYRFGHSMVSAQYQLNDSENEEARGPFKILGPLSGADSPITDLRGFRRFRLDWVVDWSLFFDGVPAPPNSKGNAPVQMSKKIDTSLAEPLRDLPFKFTQDIPSLPARNLLRGFRMGLPSGQSIAAAIGAPVVPDAELQALTEISPVFEKNTPLWYYVLAEADAMQQGKRLGAVGSRIVMETFVGLMMWDGHSFLRQDPSWQPLEAFRNPHGEFRMADFINAAIKPSEPVQNPATAGA
jgi:hypothetical protein